jgi:hydrogenase-4 transcriptional activator
MRKSSTLGWEMAQELSELQSVNGFYPNVKPKSTILLNGAGPDHGGVHARLVRSEAFSSVVYTSQSMDEVIDKIEHSRDSSAPTLITGETGTGKELIARAVHAVSPRHGRDFIPFNCGGIAPDLIASELFGYRRGAFTSADKDSKGIIREAVGGTLFLDEIGELPLAAQSKLLRFLQEGEVRPLGESRPVKVDVRVVAATNRDLEADVRSGRFRDDLYYRLNVFRVHIPPLRERREDIRPLIEHFLALRQRESGRQRLWLNDEAWELLLAYDWPGNVREVGNWSHRLVTSAVNGEVIGRKSAVNAIRVGIYTPSPMVAIGGEGMIDPDLPLHEATDKLERFLIERALEKTGGNLLRAAERLKVDRSGLRKMINRLGIKVERSGNRKPRKRSPA